MVEISTLSKPGVEQLAALTTAVWSTAFALASRLRPAPLPLWHSPGGQRVLVVAPHPDDEVAGLGGTILRHRQAGDEVAVLVVTDGRMSRAGGLGPEEMAAQRKEEARKAAAFLDVELIWAALPEGSWQPRDLSPCRPAIVAADLVYAPCAVDFHPEHLQTAHALAPLLGDSQLVRAYPIHTPLTAVLTNLATPVADLEEAINRAAAAYRSQLGSFHQAARLRRYAARRHNIPGLAETFWQMSAESYRKIHARPPAHWSEQPYRGLRARPWTDPLAYGAGRAARRQLVDQAAGR
jgi:LmbE family N-acetylglucosaminyl deacetylase